MRCSGRLGRAPMSPEAPLPVPSAALAIVLADGAVPARALLDAAWPDWDRGAGYVVAADGGARHAAAFGLRVDHWVGDAHAGFYGADVFRDVCRHNRRFAGFSRLIRADFADAAEYGDAVVRCLSEELALVPAFLKKQCGKLVVRTLCFLHADDVGLH